ncbi:MAG: carbohydrate binding domain-containing protein [Candidatus Omnitrophota bacterium]
MRNFIVAIFMFIIALGGCDNAPKEVVIDSFEGPLTKETVDYGAAEGSSVKVAADTNIKICDAQSLKIEYDLKPSGYMWVARGYNLDVKGAAAWSVKPQDVKWRSYHAVSMQIYGSNSGGVIAFDLKDSGGEIWRFIIDDDFTGWKEVICPLKEFFPRKDWQPDTADKNEIMNFPIMSFQFEPRLPGKGTYYFDCIKVIKKK